MQSSWSTDGAANQCRSKRPLGPEMGSPTQGPSSNFEVDDGCKQGLSVGSSLDSHHRQKGRAFSGIRATDASGRVGRILIPTCSPACSLYRDARLILPAQRAKGGGLAAFLGPRPL